MNWLSFIWSAMMATGLTLGVIHLNIWLRRRSALADLVFALMALSTAAMAAGELWILTSQTPAAYTSGIRWLHLPVFVTIVSIIAFVRFYLRAGRLWLAWSAIGLRLFGLMVNFLVRPNINVHEIMDLRRVQFLGQSVPVPSGIPNPLMLVTQAGTLLLVIFVADAALTAWRRGDRRAAFTVGGSFLFFVTAGFTYSVLTLWHIIPAPVFNSLFYIGVFVVMSNESARDSVRAAQLADSLRESEARFRGIFESSLEGIYRTSLEGRILMANPAMARILGYGSADDLMRSVKDITREIWETPEERTAFMRRIEAEGAVRAHECRFRRKDGTYVWVSLSAQPLFGPDGRTTSYEGQVEDIDERVMAQAELSRSEQRYRTLFEAAPAGITLVGMDNCVRMANALQAHMYGYASSQELKGFFAPLFIGRADRELMVRNMEALRAGAGPADWTYTAVRRDGSEFPVHVEAVVVRGPGGEFEGFLFLTRDLTKAVQDENERNTLRAERTHLARVLTVDQISTSLAHEINQPLGAILNNAEAARTLLAKSGGRDPVFAEIVGDIIEDAKRAGDVVRKVRQVLQKGEAQFERLSVNRLIGEVLRVVKNSLTLDNVELRLGLDPAVADVRGDRIRLQQVLLNLVTNAVDAMSGWPTKVLTVKSGMDGGDRVFVSIADTGPGIAAADHDSVFSPFFTTKKGGLGLGLPICRSIIEEHEGRLWEINGPDGGAVFSFSLKAWRARPSGPPAS